MGKDTDFAKTLSEASAKFVSKESYDEAHQKIQRLQAEAEHKQGVIDTLSMQVAEMSNAVSGLSQRSETLQRRVEELERERDALIKWDLTPEGTQSIRISFDWDICEIACFDGSGNMFDYGEWDLPAAPHRWRKIAQKAQS